MADIAQRHPSPPVIQALIRHRRITKQERGVASKIPLVIIAASSDREPPGPASVARKVGLLGHGTPGLDNSPPHRALATHV